MGIKERISKVDFSNGKINTDYRAALHNRLSEVVPDLATVRKQAQEDYVKPTDPETSKLLRNLRNFLIDFDSGHEFVELSPIGVFGIDSLLTKTSPLKVSHATGRTADVVADPGIQLAVEAYRRRSESKNEAIALSTSHRCLRLQRYSDPKFTTHFEMFATVDASIRPLSFFEEEKIISLIDLYSKYLQIVAPEAKVEIAIGNIKIAENILKKSNAFNSDHRQEILASLLPSTFDKDLKPDEFSEKVTTETTPDLNLGSCFKAMRRIYSGLPENLKNSTFYSINRMQGLGHYDGPVFQIHLNGVTLIDGGSVNWLGKLTANNKDRAVISGLGIEMLAKMLAEVSIL